MSIRLWSVIAEQIRGIYVNVRVGVGHLVRGILGIVEGDMMHRHVSCDSRGNSEETTRERNDHHLLLRTLRSCLASTRTQPSTNPHHTSIMADLRHRQHHRTDKSRRQQKWTPSL